MYRYDRVDSPTMPRESNESHEAPPTPALSSSAQSPQSSSMPSTNTSTVDDPVYLAASLVQKDTTTPTSNVDIEETAS